MAKQLEKQRLIFKINTKRLKRDNWNLTVSLKDAVSMEEVISKGDSELFRFIEKITGDKNVFKKDLVAIVVHSKTDFKRACRGFIINGIKYKRLLGTTGGVKKNTVLFINEELHAEIVKKIDNGRDLDKALVPAKFEAYRALVCTTSTPVRTPKGILVVKDCITFFKDKVIYVDDVVTDKTDRPEVKEIEDFPIELNATDGLGICVPSLMEEWAEDLQLDYVPSGACIRNSFLKGMIYPFDIILFADKIAHGNYIVKDIWGNEKDIRNIQLILTESMLKLWDSYKSIEDYLLNCTNNGHVFSIAKVTPRFLEDERSLNYQYLQSYNNLSEEDIKELVKPTVDWLKDSLCGDYIATRKFLGCEDDEEDYSNSLDFIQALVEDKRMIHDPFVVYKVNHLIKKKIDDAKIGKLRCNANYQTASGDVYALAQSIFGLEVTGLLKRGEFYSNYWNEKGKKEILLFRSPMTSHNNIRKASLVSHEEVSFWYQYMPNILIFNAWDTATVALNGEDFDGDTNFTTDNEVLLRNYIERPAIACVQRKADKFKITESLLVQANINGFGNDVGTITNRITSMFEVQAKFKEGSKEYEELQYRITCGQLYQQNSIDKLKGVLTTPMSKSWYEIRDCKNEFDLSIVAHRKPRFMIYIYPTDRAEYNKYINGVQRKCGIYFRSTIESLSLKEDKTEEEQEFLSYYEKYIPVGSGECVMNRICNFIEEEFKDTIINLMSVGFDYRILKSTHEEGGAIVEYSTKQYEKIKTLYKEYQQRVKDFSILSKVSRVDKDTSLMYRDLFKRDFETRGKALCKNSKQLCNIVVDMCYKTHNSKQFTWDICREQIIENLRNNKEREVTN